MRTQSDIERDVRAEQEWQPKLRDITAVVKDGFVQLSGALQYHRDQLEAERALRQIVDGATDHALARAALLALRARLPEVLAVYASLYEILGPTWKARPSGRMSGELRRMRCDASMG
jgi:putative protein kinase ArgK-like GTPase of G3E family